MEVTKDLYNLNLLAKLRVLLRQVLFDLVTAVIAEAIPMQNFAEHVLVIIKTQNRRRNITILASGVGPKIMS